MYIRFTYDYFTIRFITNALIFDTAHADNFVFSNTYFGFKEVV